MNLIFNELPFYKYTVLKKTAVSNLSWKKAMQIGYFYYLLHAYQV